MPWSSLTSSQGCHMFTCRNASPVMRPSAPKRHLSILHLKGVQIAHYHTKNGCFANHGFINHCTQNGQVITYCDVNPHFQNGVAEWKICNIQEYTWTALIYTCNKWPSMVTIHLWPYAMRHYYNISNSTTQVGTTLSPYVLFLGMMVAPKICHFHSLDAPLTCLPTHYSQVKGTKMEDLCMARSIFGALPKSCSFNSPGT